MKCAYLLVSHGSRDPRPQQAAEQLARQVSQRCSETQPHLRPLAAAGCLSGSERLPASQDVSLAYPYFPLVGTATLELSPVPLHQQIQQFARQTQRQGCSQVQIVPLFLLPGVHVKEDIPAEIEIAQRQLGSAVRLTQCPYLGSHPKISHLLTRKFAPFDAAGRILLSHGSRRPGGNAPIQSLATRLHALPAYWSVAPSLEVQVRNLVTAGQNRIVIQPYFLFAGGITEAIARRFEQLQLQFPTVHLLLGQPLGATVELADLISEGIEQ